MGSAVELILLLAAVAYIIVKYINIINNDTKIENQKITEEKASQLFNLIVKEAEKKGLKIDPDNSTSSNSDELSETDQVLQKIPNFSKEKFIESAKKAFELILDSFSKGDTETLEKLVSKNVAKKFQEILNQRQSEGITSEKD